MHLHAYRMICFEIVIGNFFFFCFEATVPIRQPFTRLLDTHTHTLYMDLIFGIFIFIMKVSWSGCCSLPLEFDKKGTCSRLTESRSQINCTSTHSTIHVPGAFDTECHYYFNALDICWLGCSKILIIFWQMCACSTHTYTHDESKVISHCNLSVCLVCGSVCLSNVVELCRCLSVFFFYLKSWMKANLSRIYAIALVLLQKCARNDLFTKFWNESISYAFGRVEFIK